MPLGVFEGALLTAGSGLLGAATYFYKAKQTLPFKVRVHGPRRSPLNSHRAVPPTSSVAINATEQVLRAVCARIGLREVVPALTELRAPIPG